jgi:excisionase family DNA binding protein
MHSNALAPITAHLRTPEELADLIHYHPESVRRLIREGRIKAKQFGRTWRILPEEVARILEEGLPMQEAA